MAEQNNILQLKKLAAKMTNKTVEQIAGATISDVLDIIQDNYSSGGGGGSSADVEALKSDVDAIFNTQFVKTEFELEAGYINSSGDLKNDSTPSVYRRTKDYIDIAEVLEDYACINPIANAKVFICYYNSDKTFVKREEITTSVIPDAQYGYFKLSFYRSAGSDETLFKNAMIIGKYKLNNRFEALEQEVKNTVAKSGNVITIKNGKGVFTLKRVTDTTVNVDTWRLYKGDINANGVVYNMWENSDAEGAIKIVGEDDFLCGYHGDEKMTDVNIFVDGVKLDLTKDFAEKSFANITVYVKSDVYHCNTSAAAATKAFERLKRLIFTNKTVRITNDFKALANLNIYQARLALFQCYTKYNNTNFLTNYSVNTDIACYSVDDTTTAPADSADMKSALFHTTLGTIEFNRLGGSAQAYKGTVATNFIASQNRLKVYLDDINTQTSINSGDHLTSDFEFIIR